MLEAKSHRWTQHSRALQTLHEELVAEVAATTKRLQSFAVQLVEARKALRGHPEEAESSEEEETSNAGGGEDMSQDDGEGEEDDESFLRTGEHEPPIPAAELRPFRTVVRKSRSRARNSQLALPSLPTMPAPGEVRPLAEIAGYGTEDEVLEAGGRNTRRRIEPEVPPEAPAGAEETSDPRAQRLLQMCAAAAADAKRDAENAVASAEA